MIICFLIENSFFTTQKVPDILVFQFLEFCISCEMATRGLQRFFKFYPKASLAPFSGFNTKCHEKCGSSKNKISGKRLNLQDLAFCIWIREDAFFKLLIRICLFIFPIEFLEFYLFNSEIPHPVDVKLGLI